tara:strand:+ start:1642 stop:2025 length:384 start_codon:yes stop_codon:yes gene_type:complete
LIFGKDRFKVNQQIKNKLVRFFGGNMTGKTVTRAEIAESLRKKCGLKREDAFEAIDVILHDMVSLFKKDEEVKVPLFGVFYTRQKSERIGRNPKTMEEAVIKPRRVVGLRISRLLKTRVNDACKKKK